MDVGGWLRGLGLGQYEEKFRDNKIDADVLPRLTVDDLKDIGVSVVGDRRRLLDAIAVIAGAGPASPAKSAPSKGPQASAERRPITVMFCDLVGSTSLAAKLDAEDWRNLVNAYLDEATTAVTGFGGHVLKKLGDGLMALFGYPHAQENDAERAVRAALAIQRGLADINARNVARGGPKLSTRIGIESGPVVVEATGEVFGDAPNIAARVQAVAEPGSVLVTMNVQRQVAGLFVVEEQGGRELKGVSPSVQLFRIVRASGGGRRGGARALTPVVGREEELGILARRWERARAGEGQLVLIVGEPGLGKSRLVAEFHAQLAETPHTWVEWSASQLLQNTPLHPVTEWGRQRFGVDAPAEQRLADLEGTLRLIGLDPSEHAPLLAPLVDIALPADRVSNFPPEELRRRQLTAMTAWVIAGARSQPVVLAFEDLHWADPTSLDLLRSLAERGGQAPLLLLATTRPEFRPPWTLRSHHSVISLSPLDRAGVARMVSEISASHALSKEVVEVVSERTGGVPLFVEEVTRLLVERGEQGGVQAIPPTLQQSLAARLDRLGPAREVAQIGSVLGRDFVYGLLRDIGEMDEPALQASLDRLADADLLFVEGAPPEAKYRFKHALVQDAAYESLLKSRRQALHRRAAEALRDANAEPEAIAHHLTQAGLSEHAIEWWGKAGDQALRRSAFQEAIAHLGKAIAMADNAGETPPRAPGSMAALSHRLPQLHAAYGNALIAARGHGARETIEAFTRARKSAPGDEDAPGQLAADYGLWVGSYVRGNLPSMRTNAAAFLAAVAMMPDSPEAGVAHRVVGTTHCFAGEYAEARDHLERALTLFQPGRDDDLAFRFGQDAGVAAMCYLAIASWPLGNVRRAVSLFDGAHERLASVAHIGTHPYAKLHAAAFDLIRGDRARAAENGSEAARLAREHDLPLWRAYGSFFEGFAAAERGALGEGLSDMRRGVESLRQQDLLNFDGLLKIALAEAEARAGDRDRAVAVLDEALATADHLGYRAFEAELHRARGEILRKRDPDNPAPAEEAFQTAIAVAKRQGTRSFELRAALSLAKLYQSTGRPADAHAVLAPALEGFALTDEIPEIAETQALLGALAETEEVKAVETQRQRRLHLQTAYGNALIAARGYGAPETAEAFSKARESAVGEEGASERLAADYGLWVGSFVRGELWAMRAHAKAFLGDVEARPDSPEAGVAHRAIGITRWFAGEYREAQDHLERALALFQPGRDDDFAFRFGWDAGVAAMHYLALTLWPMGDVRRAVSLVRDAQTRIAGLSHIGTHANGNMHAALFELMRGSLPHAALNAAELARIAREHDLPMWKAFGLVLVGVATAEGRGPGEALTDMRRGIELLREQNILPFDGLFKIALAGAEARAGDPDRAVASLDEALATCERTGHRSFEAELHRVRGETLLKRDPHYPAPAEEAFQSAIAIARHQGAQSFDLRAALSLAKLYQSTGRPVDAHAVLVPALEGFSSTPEMPEIAEAETLLAALGETDEVKAAIAQRQRRFDLQTSYSQALLWAKGFASEETMAAFARAGEFAGPAENAAARFGTYDAQCLRSFMRGEYRQAREIAETSVREAEAGGGDGEAGAARRMLGLICLYQGDLKAAKAALERASSDFVPERNKEAKFQGPAGDVTASAFLALTEWHLGEVERARQHIQQAIRRADELADVTTIATALFFRTILESRRDDVCATRFAADALLKLSEEYGMKTYSDEAHVYANWARGRVLDPGVGANAAMQALSAYLAPGNKADAPSLHGSLAELEAMTGEPAAALAQIDRGLAIAEETGEHFTDAYLHRLRGEILLKRDPTDPAPAEDAYRTAIAIAKTQAARGYELLASLALAKLYQSTDRPADAHAVLAPALEGFSPTPEMPEIAEAQGLLATLAELDEVKSAEEQRQRRLHLQTAYGQAMMMAKGFAAEETKTAFAHASELAAKGDDFAERFAACHGQWTLALVRGEQRRVRELAFPFLKEAEDAVRLVEVGVARRGLALSCLFTGDFLEARTHCERALEVCDPQRDRETRERFSDDTGTLAMSCLAVTSWQLGEVDRARELIDEANRRGKELGHAPSMAHPLAWKAEIELFRGDAAAALSAAEALNALSQEHGMPFWGLRAKLVMGWARGRLFDAAAGAEELRRALAVSADHGAISDLWFHTVLLAELEAEALGMDVALTHIDEALALADRVEYRCNLALAHRLRGEVLLKRDPSNPAPAEDAFQRAIVVAKKQGARSWGLRAALSLAKLYQSIGRPANAHAVLAPALEGFSLTLEMPEIAEAEALLEALAEMEEVKVAASQQQRQAQLQVAYGNALIAARGPGSPETTDAFAKARGSTFGATDAPERLAADYGLWASSYTRGESPLMRAYAAAFLSDVEPRPDSPEAGVAHRAHGVTLHFAGDYLEAREHLERALSLFRPGRDDDLAFRFGPDPGVAAMAYLAIVSWPLGEVDQAISHIDRMQMRIAAVSHIGTLAMGRMHAAMFELMRADHARATENAVELTRLAREHELPMYRAFGAFLEGWAAAQGGAPGGGVEDMRRGVENLRAQNVIVFDGLLKVALAEAETRAGDPGRAIAVLDKALVTVERAGYRAFEAELHRARGEILLKRDSANPALAEEALLTAIAVAKRQGTRSFELRAALSLAKMYKSTARPAEAHAVLAPALEGFSPTPAMPEIAEAQALLAALAETDVVRAEPAKRERRLHLQTTYGQALMLSKGFAAEETKDAFARARELAGGKENPAERFPAYFAQWVRSLARGEHRRAQRVAETFLREAEEGGYATEAGFARRCLGTSCCYQGKLLEAQTHLERALAEYQPDRDAQTRFRFGFDTRILATAHLVITIWHLGQVERARQLADRAVQSATELGHVPSGAVAHVFKTGLEVLRNDPGAALRSAETLLALVREHGMEFYVAVGEAYAGWARGRLGDPQAGAQVIRRALAEQFNETNRINAPLFHGLLAELEAATRGPDAALTLIDQGLAAAQETGEHYTDPYLHRLRGEVLFRRDPANPVPAEEAFQTAVAIAKQQGARSYELLASLSLAKLYQSTSRLAEAHSALATALEGFAPTPEMPEIAEAQALLVAFEAGTHVKHE